MKRLNDTRFQKILKFDRLDTSITEIDSSLVINADALSIIQEFPAHSINLILTDPPYHVTKKKNIFGDTSFSNDDEYLEWLGKYFREWRRILKPSGSLYCFCNSAMAAKIEILLGNNFNILSHIVWTKPNLPGYDGWKGKMKKEALRQWYPQSERIIFAEPKYEGNIYNVEFANIIKKYRKITGLSQNVLTYKIGAYGKINHGGAVSNWEAGRNTPSKIQYDKLKEVLLATGKIDTMPEYEDLVRPFNVDKTKQYTDVWNFESVRQYKGKHPAEKPVAMLRHMIAAASREGDIVLDCFAGSGNTGVAASELGRGAILIEIEQAWTRKIINKLKLKIKNISLL